jgi:hypothetical protein
MHGQRIGALVWCRAVRRFVAGRQGIRDLRYFRIPPMFGGRSGGAIRHALLSARLRAASTDEK